MKFRNVTARRRDAFHDNGDHDMRKHPARCTKPATTAQMKSANLEARLDI